MLAHCPQTTWTRPLCPRAAMQRRGGGRSRPQRRSALAHAAIPRLRSPEEQGTHIPLRTTETAAVTHFADVPLQLRVHFLGLDEVLPGRVQVLLQFRYVGRQGCQALLHLALLPRLLVNDFLELDHLGQVFLVAQRAVGGSLRGKGSLRRPCFGREGTQHFREIGEVNPAFCDLGTHRTLTAALTYMVRW